MRVRINNNNYNLYCIYSKEPIEIGERYIEVVENYLDDEIIKTYKYDYLDMLINEHIDFYDEEPEIDGDF